MKKTLLATTLATITLLSTHSAFAAESADLQVGGTIGPIACTPAFSGNGVIDYGDVKADTLKQDAYTVLPEKTLDFTITCDGKARVALIVVNSRLGTLAGSPENALSGAGQIPSGVTLTTGDSKYGAAAYGLGLAGTTKIGGYGIAMGSPTADGTTVDSIYNNSEWLTTRWVKKQAKDSLTSYGDSLTTNAWATTGTLLPMAFKNLASKLFVQAYINKGSALDLTKPIKLNGLAALELVYL